jgi:hypothetical protein
MPKKPVIGPLGLIDITPGYWYVPPVEHRGSRIQTTGVPFEKWTEYALFDRKFSTIQMVSDLIRVTKGSLKPLDWVRIWGFPQRLGAGDVFRHIEARKTVPTASIEPQEIDELSAKVATAMGMMGYARYGLSDPIDLRIDPTFDLSHVLGDELDYMKIVVSPRLSITSSGEFDLELDEQAQIELSVGPDSLQQAVWLHVAWLAAGHITDNDWRSCGECGTWIFPLDGRQRFCLPYRHLGMEDSRCRMKNSKRRQRSDDQYKIK